MPIKRKSKASLFTPPVLITLGIVIVILLSAVIVVQSNQYLRTATYDDPLTPPSVGDPWEEAKKDLYPEPTYSIIDAVATVIPAAQLITLLGGSITDDVVSPASELIAPIEACLTSENYIDDDALDKIINICKNKYPNQPFSQMSCAAAAVSEYFDKNDYIIDPVCRHYAAVMNRIVYEVDFADAQVEAGYIDFAVGSTIHEVARITICPTSGPHAGECFAYVYDDPWSHGIFYPLTQNTINYHETHPAFPIIYELAAPLPILEVPKEYLQETPDEPDTPDEPVVDLLSP